MAETLVNRVANSGIVTINLENYYPKSEFAHFDLKDFLFMEIILKEKDFRKSLKKSIGVSTVTKYFLIFCSNEAIIPLWAYMLVATHAEGSVKETYVGNQEAYLNHHYQSLIESLDLSSYAEKRIVIKGCSNKPVPAGAYQTITRRLKPTTLSIMFGEPCSMVPIYKRPK